MTNNIYYKSVMTFTFPVWLVKRKQQNSYRVCTDAWVLNEKLLKINHAFLLVWECIQMIGQSHQEVMSVENFKDTD